MKYINKRFLLASTAFALALGVSPSSDQNSFPLSFSFIAPAYAAEDFTLENTKIKVAIAEFTIPKIIVKGSNMNKEAFLNLFKSEADPKIIRERLQSFSATSLSAPEITTIYSIKMGDVVDLTFHAVSTNNEFLGFKNGVLDNYSAEKGTLKYSISTVADEKLKPLDMNVDYTLGKLSTSGVDMVGLFDIYFTTSDSDKAPLKTIIKEAKVSDVAIKGAVPNNSKSDILLNGTFGAIRYFDFKMRPMQSFTMASLANPEFLAKMNNIDKDPEQGVRTIVELYRDILSSMDAKMDMTDMKFTLTSQSKSAEDEPLPFKSISYNIGRSTFGSGAMAYNDVAVEINNGKGDFKFSMGSYSVSNFSFEPTIMALTELAKKDVILPEFEKAGAIGKLIPKLGKTELKDLNLSKTEDGKTQSVFSLKSLSFNTDEQTYGVPTTAQLSVKDFFYDKSILGENEQEILDDMGLDAIRVSFDADYAWDKGTKDFVIKALGGSVAQMGQTNVTATFKNIPDAVFTFSKNSYISLMAATIKNASVTVKDDGGVDRVLKVTAENAGTDSETLKKSLIQQIDMAEKMMGQGKEAISTISKGIQSFILKPGTLTINAEAKSANGIGMMDGMMAKDNPLGLLDLMTVTTSTK